MLWKVSTVPSHPVSSMRFCQFGRLLSTAGPKNHGMFNCKSPHWNHQTPQVTTGCAPGIYQSKCLQHLARSDRSHLPQACLENLAAFMRAGLWNLVGEFRMALSTHSIWCICMLLTFNSNMQFMYLSNFHDSFSGQWNSCITFIYRSCFCWHWRSNHAAGSEALENPRMLKRADRLHSLPGFFSWISVREMRLFFLNVTKHHLKFGRSSINYYECISFDKASRNVSLNVFIFPYSIYSSMLCSINLFG